MSIASPLSFYLLIESAPTVFTGLTNGDAVDEADMAFLFDNGQTGSYGLPLPGMTVYFGSNDEPVRLRTFAGSASSGAITVGENDSVTPYVSDNESITIKAQWRLWPIYPRIIQSGTAVNHRIDYNVPYTDQLEEYKPVAVAGPPAVVEWNGATAQASFVGDRSFDLGIGTTLTGYLWTAPGSVEGTSISQGTEGSPVTFTWTSPGQKLVYLTVTDSNGKTATNYTWVFVVDPNNPSTVAYTDFDSFNDNFDYEQGGGSCSFTVHGSAGIANFPNESLVILASRPTTPAQTTPTGYWPFRDNIHFVGYIVGTSVRQNPIDGDVSFQAQTIDGLMKNLTAFPVSLTTKNSPNKWTEAKRLITDRAASYLWHYHSTLSLMAPIVPSGYAGLIWRQDFGPSDLFSQLSSELMASLWGKVVVNHQGVVHHLTDYNLMNDTERTAVTVRKTIHKGVWVDEMGIEERMTYSQPVNIIKMSGVIYPGGEVEDVCPSFSESPGSAPKPFGREMNYDRLILTTQSDLNVRCGRALAKANVKYSAFTTRFINDGSFTIAPQELFPSRIEANDNDRGLALTTRLIPRRISRSFDAQNGLIDYAVGFEPETDGPAGTTVDLPCGPPDQESEEPIPPPESAAPPSALALANQGSSFYYAEALGVAWERRVAGLTTLEFRDMVPDPWSYFKQGTGIDNVILWGCGPGFLARSENTGRNWSDHTAYMDDPPNSWADATAPGITGSVVRQVLGDWHRQDVFYCLILANTAGVTGSYRGWIYHTTDDGFNFTPYALTGSSQAYPLRMDIDTEDSSILWLTLMEGTSLNLRKYGVTGTGLTLSSTTVLMTGTSASLTRSRAYIAYPYTPFGDKDSLYIYGNLEGSPVLPTGTICAIMKSTNQGASFSPVITDWLGDHCAALAVGDAVNGNRELWAVRQQELQDLDLED
jgi:hypothetical protein